MRALPALRGRAVIAALERAGFEVIRTKGSHHFPRHRNDPSRKQSCRCIETTCHPAHFARYCGKPASAGLSFSTCSEQKARVGQALSSSSSALASFRSGVPKPSVNQP
jgi:hypothetical protein